MNRAIRHVWLAAVAIFAVLLLALTSIMFFQQRSLAADPWNTRSLYQQFGKDRGPILAGGQEVARSVPTDGDYAYQREYTDGEVYAPLTGYFSPIYGATGLENAMGEQLSGDSDSQFYDRVVATLSGNQPSGASVEMTVDPQLQELAYSLLNGRKGSIVALEPSTGRILAMVSSPSYDPNLLASHDSAGVIEASQRLNADVNQPMSNRAIAGNLYSPGSTFKIVDLVAALESGDYTTDSTIPNPQNLQLPNTSTTLPNYVGGNCASRTEADLEFAFNNSCNTPFAQIAMDLGQDRIRQTAENFGYGQDLSIPLTVTPSTFPTDLDDASLAMSAIGQYDVRSTPLQVAMISSAIANDGVLMRPQLIQEVRSSDLSVIDSFRAQQMQRSTSADVANTVTDLMVSSVDNGIARGAQVPGYSVAGKTGTAEIGASGTSSSWFTGFAPADNPQVAVAVVYDDIPAGQSSDATANAQQMFEAVLNG
ncbi:peptidoglycan D,D-transpeptidase FtsI family protein [Kocuria sp.]|uniref:peptidoglycan D,D-transpeptidase FtsI family protein n=1 Tax=Kocuria sp. TaxID=1871328 RepID=UPI0026DEC3CE|nr:penicillin-binding protein 2 [Kocuria sp.]MDO5619733.1 penicillin-binding protein 2 [Kocuria sp.]